MDVNNFHAFHDFLGGDFSRLMVFHLLFILSIWCTEFFAVSRLFPEGSLLFTIALDCLMALGVIKSKVHPSHLAHRAALSPIFQPSAKHQPKLQDHGHGAVCYIRGMPVCSLPYAGTAHCYVTWTSCQRSYSTVHLLGLNPLSLIVSPAPEPLCHWAAQELYIVANCTGCYTERGKGIA